ncbi:MAG TPA: protein-export chaperone SecB [Woeseiaceae bacterium]|jgi:preprotein translocase subunit SecB|nr:protein-export chaperone SecB [Woeseiaceae bacterium]
MADEKPGNDTAAIDNLAASEGANAGQRIAITKIYIKDMSFESPQTPNIFRGGEWKPQTNLNLRSSHTAMENDHHEVVLTITIEAKAEDKTLFLCELAQAGIFEIAGYEQEEFNAITGSFCPNILFPYAREAIAGAIQKGGFPEFVLQPINFDAVYMQSRQQAAQQATGEKPETH